jgi:cell division protein FtsZ
MDEIAEITDYIQDEAGMDADVIWGHGKDETLGEKLSIAIIATGFQSTPDTGVGQKVPERVKRNLNDEVNTNITAPIESPTQTGLPKGEAPVLEETEDSDNNDLLLDDVQISDVNSNSSEDQTELPTVETESQQGFVFDMTPKNDQTVEDTSNDPDVKRYILEDDAESSTLDTWVESGLKGNQEEVDSWNDSSEKEQEKEWQPILKDTSETEKEDEEIVEESTMENDQLSVEDEVTEPMSGNTDDVAQTSENWNNEPDAGKEELHEENEIESNVSKEEQEQLAEERIARIKRISLKLKTPSGIADLEDEPAYKRRNIKLDDVEASDETPESRLSLGENEDGTTGLSSGNSFLHDNVD